MAIILKEAIASQEIPLGPFLDSTDGDTAETGLTIANTDILLWKTGATTLAAKNSGGATHISGGIYYTVLDATDTDTVGPMVVFVHVSGALAVKTICEVVPANIFDSRYSTDYLQVDVIQLNSVTASATNLERSASVIVTGAAETGTLSTTQMTSGLTEATDDHYIGRIIIWTTGPLAGQASDITDYTGATGMLTYTAVTEAPSNGDTFVIV